jgi:hypothetical protein
LGLCGCMTLLLHGQDLSRSGFNSPRKDVYVSMFLDFVCVFSHLSQNVDMATHFNRKFAIVLKHLKSILLPS